MALPIFQRTVVNSTGDIIPNAQVTVREAGTQTLATIYQDEGGLTPKSNPFLTDSSGLARFYAAPQVVDVAVTAASGAISWIDIQLIDTQDITTIGSNFAAVETVADNISSVISVLDNIENIDTVADNIANVNATGSNIAAVIDAPNQAAIATTQAGIATTQANNASSSASTATTQAGIATTQAGIATTQAGIATTKASEAATSAASVNANNIVHAPNSGLPNEAGTAYDKDVTTSATDTTAGRLLKVGDFGLGRLNTQFTDTALEISNLDEATTVGFYAVDNNASGALPAGYDSGIKGSLVVMVEGGTGSRVNQIFMQGHDNNKIWWRGQDTSGAWLSWMEFYHTGNILGTVSQSSGVPTGAIIQRGSNANGEFVKYADGTLIVIRAGSTAITLSCESSLILSTVLTFPVSFVNANYTLVLEVPSASAEWSNSSVRLLGSYAFTSNKGTGSSSIGLFLTTTSTTTVTNCSALAIGRWY
jgi:hypothetical protein